MSFSSDVKEELSKQLNKSRHCQLAELAAMIHLAGKITTGENGTELEIATEHAAVAKRCYTLIKRAFDISAETVVRGSYVVRIPSAEFSEGDLPLQNPEDVRRILQAIKFLDANGIPTSKPELVDGLMVQNVCCKRAYIRGAFLTAGSMSAPQKSYHFEIVCITRAQAEQLQIILSDFVTDAKIVQRKKYYIVYIKEGAQIVDVLNVMEAHLALMDFENVRILKEMRNSVNRQVNCETANINKTVNAAVKQMEDIEYIERRAGLGYLPDNLRIMAELRLQYPDAPLKELGEYLNPPVGKSGVNHRLRKISAIAEELRGYKEEIR